MNNITRRGRKFRKGTSNDKHIRDVVKGVLSSKIEKKYAVNTAATVVSSTTVLLPLSQVPQGVQDNDRIGDSILNKNLKIDIIMQSNTSSTSGVFRVTIFRWIPPNAPTSANIYFPGIANIQAPLFQDYEQSYVIMYDKLLNCSKGSLSDIGTVILQLNMKAKGRQEYVAGSATLGSNQIYMLVTSSGITSATAFWASTFEYYDA